MLSPTDGVNSNIYQSGEENGEDDEDDFMFPDNIDFLEQQVKLHKA